MVDGAGGPTNSCLLFDDGAVVDCGNGDSAFFLSHGTGSACAEMSIRPPLSLVAQVLCYRRVYISVAWVS